MLRIIRKRMQTFAYVHQIGRMRILGTMDGCHFYHRGKYLVEIHTLLLPETFHDDSSFVSWWIPPFSLLQFVYPLVPKCSFPFRQLGQFIRLVLLQGIHFLLHGTLPLSSLPQSFLAPPHRLTIRVLHQKIFGGISSL